MTLNATNAIIFLKNSQRFDDDSDNVEIMAEGSYYNKNGKHYIVYKETELTGMQGCTTTIKVAEQVVSMIRLGEVNSSIVYEQGKEYNCIYSYGFGQLSLDIKTNKLDIDISEFGGKIFIEYDMDMGGTKSNNKLTIDIKVKY